MNRSQSGVSSSLLSTKDMFSGELTSNTNKTGVGVLFQIDGEGRVIVKTIVGGGAADRTRGTGAAHFHSSLIPQPSCPNLGLVLPV
jgi:hypothetical protein